MYDQAFRSHSDSNAFETSESSRLQGYTYCRMFATRDDTEILNNNGGFAMRKVSSADAGGKGASGDAIGKGANENTGRTGATGEAAGKSNSGADVEMISNNEEASRRC